MLAVFGGAWSLPFAAAPELTVPYGAGKSKASLPMGGFPKPLHGQRELCPTVGLVP